MRTTETRGLVLDLIDGSLTTLRRTPHDPAPRPHPPSKNPFHLLRGRLWSPKTCRGHDGQPTGDVTLEAFALKD